MIEDVWKWAFLMLFFSNMFPQWQMLKCYQLRNFWTNIESFLNIFRISTLLFLFIFLRKGIYRIVWTLVLSEIVDHQRMVIMELLWARDSPLPLDCRTIHLRIFDKLFIYLKFGFLCYFWVKLPLSQYFF